MTSVVVADDAPLIREAIAAVVASAGMTVVGMVGTAEALLAAVATALPDVAVVDVRMPPTYRLEGLQAALQLRDQYPRLGILLLSQHVEPQYLRRLLAGGSAATGYLLKERAAGIAEFVDAIQTVATGGCVFDPEVVSALVSSRRAADVVGALSPREQQVLQLMAEGCSNAAIAVRLRMVEKTVESHIRRVFQRLDLVDEPDTNRRVRAVLTYLDTLTSR